MSAPLVLALGSSCSASRCVVYPLYMLRSPSCGRERGPGSMAASVCQVARLQPQSENGGALLDDPLPRHSSVATLSGMPDNFRVVITPSISSPVSGVRTVSPAPVKRRVRRRRSSPSRILRDPLLHPPSPVLRSPSHPFLQSHQPNAREFVPYTRQHWKLNVKNARHTTVPIPHPLGGSPSPR